MRKKWLLAFALMALAPCGLFANSLWSAGGGLYNGFRGEIMTLSDPGVNAETFALDIGVWGFIDARYVELSLALTSGPAWGLFEAGVIGDMYRGNSVALDASLMGKLPFSAFFSSIAHPESKVSGFWSAGIGFNAVLLSAMWGEPFPSERAIDLSTLSARLGCGVDADISDRLYLRTHLFLGLNLLASKDARDAMAEMEKDFNVSPTIFGLTAALKIGIGIRL